MGQILVATFDLIPRMPNVFGEETHKWKTKNRSRGCHLNRALTEKIVGRDVHIFCYKVQNHQVERNNIKM